jgi:hypothetical protein
MTECHVILNIDLFFQGQLLISKYGHNFLWKLFSKCTLTNGSKLTPTMIMRLVMAQLYIPFQVSSPNLLVSKILTMTEWLSWGVFYQMTITLTRRLMWHASVIMITDLSSLLRLDRLLWNRDLMELEEIKRWKEDSRLMEMICLNLHQQTLFRVQQERCLADLEMLLQWLYQ